MLRLAILNNRQFLTAGQTSSRRREESAYFAALHNRAFRERVPKGSPRGFTICRVVQQIGSPFFPFLLQRQDP